MLALLAHPLAAGDLADVKTRGKLVVVIFPNQDIPFVQVKLENMRERNLKLTEMRNPDDFQGIDIVLVKGFEWRSARGAISWSPSTPIWTG